MRAVVTRYTEPLGEALQRLNVNAFDLLAFAADAHDHHALVVDSELSFATTRTSRVFESFVESPQLFDDSVTRCSSWLY